MLYVEACDVVELVSRTRSALVERLYFHREKIL